MQVFLLLTKTKTNLRLLFYMFHTRHFLTIIAIAHMARILISDLFDSSYKLSQIGIVIDDLNMKNYAILYVDLRKKLISLLQEKLGTTNEKGVCIDIHEY